MTEACALEGIGRSHLQDGEPGQAASYLQQALTIYQRIGVPGARHVRLASLLTTLVLRGRQFGRRLRLRAQLLNQRLELPAVKRPSHARSARV